ncbi:hypothetical protein [Aureivirga sp. CE67]|uniref:hypothetical protein n=1 Tax=Aureivirga sp. CE67 TaxID=1788983 RepID=UPI0018CA7A36|nr:hypothetical protein [Aureivirga sp. CE67]
MSFFTDTFGKRKKVWKNFAQEIGAEHVDKGYFSTDYILYKYKNWELKLDVYSTGGESQIYYTRLRVAVENFSGFKMHIYQENMFNRIGKIFGLQDIQIGDFHFDPKFIIKGNNPNKLQQVLADRSLRNHFFGLKYFDFHLSPGKRYSLFKSYPEHVFIMKLDVYTLIKNPEDLRNMFDLFTKTLDRTAELNLITWKSPNVKL